ncbi:hypothetical protein [Streptomyces sp. NPDC096132]|uniref:hypothetical protein n=1 Tax=Streptomyces sp. NPDC096132 TaxID=3366075 RepID=UPI003805F40B
MKLRYTAFMAVTVLGAAACDAGSEPVRGPEAALERATERMEDAGSAEVSTTTDLGAGSTPNTLEGAYSWGDAYAFDVQVDPEQVGLDGLTDSAKMSMRYVDGTVYFDIEPQPSGPLKGKEWLKVAGQGSAAYGSSSSPMTSMKALAYADRVEDLGKQTVNGRNTTHYRAVIDKEHTDRYQKLYPDESVLEAFVSSARAITMDVWLGADGLPVRTAHQIGAMSTTSDFRKFGVENAVKAPPASQLADYTAAVEGLTRDEG